MDKFASLETINSTPFAQDDEVITSINSPIEISVLENDVPGDGDYFMIMEVEEPTNGEIRFDEEVIVYEPNLDFLGEDVFKYVVEDGNGQSTDATVRVTVTDID